MLNGYIDAYKRYQKPIAPKKLGPVKVFDAYGRFSNNNKQLDNVKKYQDRFKQL